MSLPKITELTDSNTCELCKNALAKYSCPKCAAKYCSLSCYQSPAHLECSEQFYKAYVEEELSRNDDEETKKKMYDILERNNLENEAKDSDDESIDDMVERFAGVDLDDTDQVWGKLSQDEQQEFLAFIKSEDVTKLIPQWNPWWLYSSKLVEDIDKSDCFKKSCPLVLPIKKFFQISAKTPASTVNYNLVNIIAAYAFTSRYFNGEHHDFAKEVATCTISLSLTLKDGQNFENFNEAVKSVEMQCLQSEWIRADSENFTKMREDTNKILKGPNPQDSKFYILCALSDLHTLLNLAMKNEEPKTSKIFPLDNFPDVKVESKRKIRMCLKKLEYFLSFTRDIFNADSIFCLSTVE